MQNYLLSECIGIFICKKELKLEIRSELNTHTVPFYLQDCNKEGKNATKEADTSNYQNKNIKTQN